MARDRQAGVILINVLAVVALASAVVITMLTLADSAIGRSQRFGDAAQASAYAIGAETSAAVALRRDMNQAPEVDHNREPWATVAQEQVRIEGGVFSLAIEDAQSRYNLNNLLTGDMLAIETLRKIAAALELPAKTADRAATFVQFGGPLGNLGELSAAGVDARSIEVLGGLVTTLPTQTEINVNTAGEPLLGVLLANPVAARFLVSRRDRAGFLTEDDLSRARILLPPGVGFRSEYFRVTVDVTLGRTRQRISSLLQRSGSGDGARVIIVERKREGVTPMAPPLR